MINTTLYNYIKSQLDRGRTREQIGAALIQQGGWSHEDVEAAFNVVQTGIIPAVAQNYQEARPDTRKAKDHTVPAIIVGLALIGVVAVGYYFQTAGDAIVMSADQLAITLPPQFSTLGKLKSTDIAKLSGSQTLGFSKGIDENGCVTNPENEPILFSCIRKDASGMGVTFLVMTHPVDQSFVSNTNSKEGQTEYLAYFKNLLQTTQPPGLFIDAYYADIVNANKPGMLATYRSETDKIITEQKHLYIVKGKTLYSFQFGARPETVSQLWPFIEQSIWAGVR